MGEEKKEEEEEKDLLKPLFKFQLNYTKIFVKKSRHSHFLN